MTSLTRNGINIGDEGTTALAGRLRVNHTLATLTLMGNKIGTKGKEASRESIDNLLNRNKNIVTKIAEAFAKVDDKIIGSKLKKF